MYGCTAFDQLGNCTAWELVERVVPYSDLGLTAEAVAQAVGWGAGAILALWAIGYGAAVVVDLLRRV